LCEIKVNKIVKKWIHRFLIYGTLIRHIAALAKHVCFTDGGTEELANKNCPSRNGNTNKAIEAAANKPRDSKR